MPVNSQMRGADRRQNSPRWEGRGVLPRARARHNAGGDFVRCGNNIGVALAMVDWIELIRWPKAQSLSHKHVVQDEVEISPGIAKPAAIGFFIEQTGRYDRAGDLLCLCACGVDRPPSPYGSTIRRTSAR